MQRFYARKRSPISCTSWQSHIQSDDRLHFTRQCGCNHSHRLIINSNHGYSLIHKCSTNHHDYLLNSSRTRQFATFGGKVDQSRTRSRCAARGCVPWYIRAPVETEDPRAGREDRGAYVEGKVRRAEEGEAGRCHRCWRADARAS